MHGPAHLQRTLPEVTSQTESCRRIYASIVYNRLTKSAFNNPLEM